VSHLFVVAVVIFYDAIETPFFLLSLSVARGLIFIEIGLDWLMD